jgi:hypothetical protein
LKQRNRFFSSFDRIWKRFKRRNWILRKLRIRELLLNDLEGITRYSLDADHLLKVRAKVLSVELERISTHLFCPFLKVDNCIESKKTTNIKILLLFACLGMQSDHFTIIDDRASTLPTIGRHEIGEHLLGGLILENPPVSFFRGHPLLAKLKVDSYRLVVSQRLIISAIFEGVAVN